MYKFSSQDILMQMCSGDMFLLPTFDITIQLSQQSRARLNATGFLTINSNSHCGFHNMLTPTDIYNVVLFVSCRL